MLDKRDDILENSSLDLFFGGAFERICEERAERRFFFYLSENERAGFNDLKVCSCYAIKWC